MDNLIIEQVLGVEFSVLCNDGEVHTISLLDLINNKNSSMSVVKDDMAVPRCIIDIHLECDGYSWVIDKV